MKEYRKNLPETWEEFVIFCKQFKNVKNYSSDNTHIHMTFCNGSIAFKSDGYVNLNCSWYDIAKLKPRDMALIILGLNPEETK